jgi:hypothetical protein
MKEAIEMLENIKDRLIDIMILAGGVIFYIMAHNMIVPLF